MDRVAWQMLLSEAQATALNPHQIHDRISSTSIADFKYVHTGIRGPTRPVRPARVGSWVCGMTRLLDD